MSMEFANRAEPNETSENGASGGPAPLGHVDWDASTATNERVLMRSPPLHRDRIVRDQYVRIDDPLGARSGFLGRVVTGPFFSPPGAPGRGPGLSLGLGNSGEIAVFAEIELLGELVNGHQRA